MKRVETPRREGRNQVVYESAKNIYMYAYVCIYYAQVSKALL